MILHLEPYPNLVLDGLDGLVEAQGDDAQHDDAGDYHVQLEHLGAVYDQIPKPPPGRQELPDDDPHQRQPDVHLGGAEQDGHGARQHHLQESVPPCAPQSVDQRDLLIVHLLEARVEADDGAEDRHGHAGHDDGPGAGAQPDDEKRRQGRFRQAVEHHQVGLQYLGQLPGVPQQRGHQEAERDHQQEAQHRLQQRHADVGEHGIVPDLVHKAARHAAGAGEEKAVDPLLIGADLPQDDKQDEDERAPGSDFMVVPSVLSDELLLPGQFGGSLFPFSGIRCQFSFHVSDPPIAY